VLTHQVCLQQVYLESIVVVKKCVSGIIYGLLRTMCAIGHSAKFGSYTLMHVETNKILDLQLIQVSKDYISIIMLSIYCQHLHILNMLFL